MILSFLIQGCFKHFKNTFKFQQVLPFSSADINCNVTLNRTAKSFPSLDSGMGNINFVTG